MSKTFGQKVADAHKAILDERQLDRDNHRNLVMALNSYEGRNNDGHEVESDAELLKGRLSYVNHNVAGFHCNGGKVHLICYPAVSSKLHNVEDAINATAVSLAGFKLALAEGRVSQPALTRSD